MAYGDGHIFWYNSRWYEYTGTTPEQMEGWGWKSVHDPEVLPAVMERWTASIRTGENFEMVFPLRRADGSFRPFLTRVVPIRDEGGRIVRWFGTNTDITGQKEIERELRNANADLEQFAYSASHDLQEPLRTVKIFSQMLAARAKEKLDAESLEYLDNVISGATRMEALVRDLLVYARTSRLEKPAEPTDANHAIQAALENLKGAIAETGAIIDFERIANSAGSSYPAGAAFSESDQQCHQVPQARRNTRSAHRIEENECAMALLSNRQRHRHRSTIQGADFWAI